MEGWFVLHKRVYRRCPDDGLSLSFKKPHRNISAENRGRPIAAAAANEMWSMDFVSDALLEGRRLRALTVVDAAPVRRFRSTSTWTSRVSRWSR